LVYTSLSNKQPQTNSLCPVSFSFIGVGRPLEPSIQLQYNTRGLSAWLGGAGGHVW